MWNLFVLLWRKYILCKNVFLHKTVNKINIHCRVIKFKNWNIMLVGRYLIANWKLIYLYFDLLLLVYSYLKLGQMWKSQLIVRIFKYYFFFIYSICCNGSALMLVTDVKNKNRGKNIYKKGLALKSIEYLFYILREIFTILNYVREPIFILVWSAPIVKHFSN